MRRGDKGKLKGMMRSKGGNFQYQLIWKVSIKQEQKWIAANNNCLIRNLETNCANDWIETAIKTLKADPKRSNTHLLKVTTALKSFIAMWWDAARSSKTIHPCESTWWLMVNVSTSVLLKGAKRSSSTTPSLKDISLYTREKNHSSVNFVGKDSLWISTWEHICELILERNLMCAHFLDVTRDSLRAPT